MTQKPDPFLVMQSAVDIVMGSEHPTSKVAASLLIQSQDQFHIISNINHWPDKISSAIGKTERIGNASGTIHAETACLFQSLFPTELSDIFITDPPCPNCVKNLALAGVKRIYIDHKGFDKTFAKKRESVFKNMSLVICQKAGIEVLKLNRKEQKIEPLISPDKLSNADFQGVVFKKDAHKKDAASFDRFIDEQRHFYNNHPFACTLMIDKNNPDLNYWVSVKQSWPPGFMEESHTYHDEPVIVPDNKYSFHCEPLNALVMLSLKIGAKLHPDLIYSSRIPTSRELVNFVGAGYNKIKIGNNQAARDIHAPQALQKLIDAHVITVT